MPYLACRAARPTRPCRACQASSRTCTRRRPMPPAGQPRAQGCRMTKEGATPVRSQVISFCTFPRVRRVNGRANRRGGEGGGERTPGREAKRGYWLYGACAQDLPGSARCRVMVRSMVLSHGAGACLAHGVRAVAAYPGRGARRAVPRHDACAPVVEVGELAVHE